VVALDTACLGTIIWEDVVGRADRKCSKQVAMRDQTRLLLVLQNQVIEERGRRPDAVLN